MKLTGRCSCGCFVVLEEDPAIFGLDGATTDLSIERRFEAWQEEHRACWRPASTIHRLFSQHAPKIYKGAALESRWKLMTPRERIWYSVAVVLSVAACLILLLR